jgi:Flp pilus assembly pilin Flp
MRIKAEDGVSSVEYGLIAGLIAAVVFAGVFAVGQTSQASWENSCSKITAPMGATCP